MTMSTAYEPGDVCGYVDDERTSKQVKGSHTKQKDSKPRQRPESGLATRRVTSSC